MAAEAGIDLVSFALVTPPWPPPGQEVDWSTVNAQCQRVLDANPRALLLPRIGVGAPQWWREAHPGDAMAWDRDPQRGRGTTAVASPAYRRDAAAWLAALIEHLEKTFGPHIVGYHPCGQNTGEWFYLNTWGPALNGYSPATRDAWRGWLRQRYKTDAALQAAWGRSAATLATATVPSPESRRAAPAGTLRDPADERSLIDFAEFQQQMMSECVVLFANTVRTATRGKKMVVFFYGYVFEFGAVGNGPATSGHYMLRRVLDCPDIDVLCSPISYFDRGLGGSGPAMTAAESVALAGKMWLYEDDTATYLSPSKHPDAHPPSSRGSKPSNRPTPFSCATRPSAPCGTSARGGWIWAARVGSGTAGCGARWSCWRPSTSRCWINRARSSRRSPPWSTSGRCSAWPSAATSSHGRASTKPAARWHGRGSSTVNTCSTTSRRAG